jgi:hypothetical protein
MRKIMQKHIEIERNFECKWIWLLIF